MIDLSKLPMKMRHDIASRLGWGNGEDQAPYLEEMANMTPDRALRAYCAWHLGTEAWADFFLDAQEALKKAEVK